MAVVDGALTARARKRLDKRNAEQAEETEKRFKEVPEPAEVDLKKQILTECYDAAWGSSGNQHKETRCDARRRWQVHSCSADPA